MMMRALQFMLIRRKCLVQMCIVLLLLLISGRHAATNPRSCRRLARNTGWLDIVWNTYSEARFKKTFRVSRKTFNYILNRIRGKLEHYLPVSAW